MFNRTLQSVLTRRSQLALLLGLGLLSNTAHGESFDADFFAPKVELASVQYAHLADLHIPAFQVRATATLYVAKEPEPMTLGFSNADLLPAAKPSNTQNQDFTTLLTNEVRRSLKQMLTLEVKNEWATFTLTPKAITLQAQGLQMVVKQNSTKIEWRTAF